MAGFFKSTFPCRKHPKHKQSPGVCSLCLNEKLSQLSGSNKKNQSSPPPPGSSSSISSLSSSSNVSSCASPLLDHYCIGGRNSIRVFMNTGHSVLEKSRSVAFGFRRRKEEEKRDEHETKIGFLWKLLLFRRNNKGLMHRSRSTRERGFGA